MAGVTMILSRAHDLVLQSIIGSRELVTMENPVPCHIWSGSVVCGIMWAGVDPGMIECIECPLTILVLSQSLSQTLLTEPGTRQRHSRAAVPDHKVYVF